MLLKNIFIPSLLFLFTFVVYAHNITTDVLGGDSGDFISASFVGGVPHPSGYPSYTILGIISLHLPVALTPIEKMALISAFFSALCIVLIYFLIEQITSRKDLSVACSLCVAFTYPFWFYAEVVEVFALHNFFVIALILFTIKFVYLRKKIYLYLLSLTAGLSLTNNLIIFLLFPPLTIALLATKAYRKTSGKSILFLIFLFLLGLSPYIYLPIAASQNPPINWGNPINLENFINVITRKLYGWGKLRLSDPDIFAMSVNMIAYIQHIYVHVRFLIPFIIPGVYYLAIKKRFISLFTLLTCLIMFGPAYGMYSKYNLQSFQSLAIQEKFFTTSIIMIIIISSFGALLCEDFLARALRYFASKKPLKINNSHLLTRLRSFGISSVLLATYFLTIFSSNFKKTDMSKIYYGQNLAEDILGSVPENSVLWLTDDTITLNILYVQNVLKKYTNITVPGHFSGISIIKKHLGNNSDINLEHNRGYDNKVTLDARYSSLAPLIKSTNVFSDIPIEIYDDIYGKIISVPYGIIYKLEFEKEFTISSNEFIEITNRLIESYKTEQFSNQYVMDSCLICSHIKSLYTLGWLNASKFLTNYYKDNSNSKIFEEKAFVYFPEYITYFYKI
jgi:hypothetical protein